MIPAGASAHEECRVRRVAVEDFADHPHLRILAMQGCVQIAYEGARHVLNSVLAYAVDASDADPPEGVLNLIARHFRLVLIHVRHIAREPAVERATPRLCRRVW